MQGTCRRWLSFSLIAVVFSTSALAQVDKAILYPGQGITLNGSSIQTSSAVVSGDTVQTADTTAQLVGQGLIAQVHPDSRVQYGDILILSCGGVLVSSSANAVQASDTRVAPQNGTAKFEMINRGGKLTINVQSGTVRVSSDKVSMLTAGQSTEVPSSDTCSVIAGLKPVAPATSGRAKWLLIGTAGVAGAVGIYIVERSPSSPSAP